jgi:hypothetical protein
MARGAGEMSDQNESYAPKAIAARVEILDRIHLYCHAYDRQHWELFANVFHDDGTCRLSTSGGHWKDWVEQNRVLWKAALLVTHHQVGNTLIGFDGDVANAETYVTAYHRVRADAPPHPIIGGTGQEYEVLVGVRYIDRFECRKEKWLIAQRRTASVWRHYQDVRDGTLASVPVEFRSAFGEEDVSRSVIKHWLS